MSGWYNGFSPTQRARGGRWLNAEYAAGRRTRPTSCEACGQTHGALMAHSEDYSGPPFGPWIGRFSLCYRCHLMVHSRHRAAAAWEAYVASLEDGWIWPPTGSSAWPTIQAMLEQGGHLSPPKPAEDHLPWSTAPAARQLPWPAGDPSVLRAIARGDYRPSS